MGDEVCQISEIAREITFRSLLENAASIFNLLNMAWLRDAKLSEAKHFFPYLDVQRNFP